jgi:hypothetical protein
LRPLAAALASASVLGSSIASLTSFGARAGAPATAVAANLFDLRRASAIQNLEAIQRKMA